jgi:hypothetical protein
VFTDWLDLMLNAFLSLSVNVDRYSDVGQRVRQNKLDESMKRGTWLLLKGTKITGNPAFRTEWVVYKGGFITEKDSSTSGVRASAEDLQTRSITNANVSVLKS